MTGRARPLGHRYPVADVGGSAAGDAPPGRGQGELGNVRELVVVEQVEPLLDDRAATRPEVCRRDLPGQPGGAGRVARGVRMADREVRIAACLVPPAGTLVQRHLHHGLAAPQLAP